MPKGSYAEAIYSARLMLSGLSEHQGSLGKRGIEQAFIDEFGSLQAQAQKLDSEQESLKARLKEKTAELDKVMKQLGKKHSESKKLVKLDIPSVGWREFGISDSR